MATAQTDIELPIPRFYDPRSASDWAYSPDQAALTVEAAHWRHDHGLHPAAEDETRVQLLLVDLQKDFCFPEGSLYVGGRSGHGATEDNDRIARFIYRNLGRISQITCTLDTHHPFQIFSPGFWLGEDGRPPAPHREVSVDDVRSGRLRPNPALAWLTGGDAHELNARALRYCEALERQGKYRLYLWPPHCVLGSDGHALAGVIHEARLFHAFSRLAPAPARRKGEEPLTEFYSVLRPEVTAGDATLEHRGDELLAELARTDVVIVAGQAASHCVKTTLEDMARRLSPEERSKVYILRDCMSSVAVPDPAKAGCFLSDFTDEAEHALERFAAQGMHVVESTTPMAEWP